MIHSSSDMTTYDCRISVAYHLIVMPIAFTHLKIMVTVL